MNGNENNVQHNVVSKEEFLVSEPLDGNNTEKNIVPKSHFPLQEDTGERTSSTTTVSKSGFRSTLSEVNVDNNVTVAVAEPSVACFFAENHNSIYESQERSAHLKIKSKCSGALNSFQRLLDTPAGKFPGYNMAQLILLRGTANPDIDFSNINVRNGIAKKMICKIHEEELGFGWDLQKYDHIIRNRQPGSSKRIPVCSMPNGCGCSHESNIRRPHRIKHTVTVKECEAVLKQHGIFAPPGTPACDMATDFLKNLVQPSADDNHAEHDFDIMDFETEENDPVTEIPAEKASRIEAINALKKISDAINVLDDDFSSPASSSQESQSGENEKLDGCILALAKVAGLSISSEKKTFDVLQKDTQQRKIKKLYDLTHVLAKRIAPSNPEHLEKMFFNKYATSTESKKPQQQLEILISYAVEQYNAASTGKERIEALSQIAQATQHKFLQQFIPNLSEYQYYAAKHLASKRLDTWNIPVPKQVRTRYVPEHVNIFIQFITSPAIMVGLPYGTRTAKTPSGKKYEIASTLRKHSDAEIIRMFYHYLQEIGKSDIVICESVLRKILKMLSAHRQKSLFCVNYFEAAGKMAFDKIFVCLGTMIQEYWIDDRTFEEIKMKLEESKLYLSTDYSLHVKEYARVAEHCINYALSDTNNSEFRAIPCEQLEEYPHAHDFQCDRCQLFTNVMEMLKSVVKDLSLAEPNNDKLAEIRDEILKSEVDIWKWKLHIIRAVSSEIDRIRIIQSLKNNQASAHLDFAQKYNPSYFYETQKQYYGKKHLSWHPSAFTAMIDGELKQHTVTHLLGYEDQNAKSVVAIITDLLEKCKQWGIESIILRSDNAGYYRNAALLQTIPILSEQIGVHVTEYSFSEAQVGKGPSDREGARQKVKLKESSNNKMNITNKEEMFTALTSGAEQLAGLTVVAASVDDETEESPPNIPGISAFSAVVYDYEKRTFTLWKHFGKGKGKTFKFPDNTLKAKLNITKQTDDSPQDNNDFWRKQCSLREKQKKRNGSETVETTESTQEEDSESSSDDTNGSQKAKVGRKVNTADPKELPYQPKRLFDCPEANCTRKYSKHHTLQQHIERGNHNYFPEKLTLYDTALNLFTNHLEHVQEQKMDMYLKEALENYGKRQSPLLKEGFALREGVQRVRFSDKVHDFIDKELSVCLQDKKRFDAQSCEKKMAIERTNDGRLLFSPFERLNANQIAALVKRKLEKMGENPKEVLSKKKQKELRDAINKENENDTGEMEIEFQDEPLFHDAFDAVHEESEACRGDLEKEDDPDSKKRTSTSRNTSSESQGSRKRKRTKQ